MVAFDGVIGVNQAPDLRREIKVGGKFSPVILPGTHSHGIFVIPLLCQALEIGFGRFSGGGLIDGLEVADKGLAIFVGHVARCCGFDG